MGSAWRYGLLRLPAMTMAAGLVASSYFSTSSAVAARPALWNRGKRRAANSYHADRWQRRDDDLRVPGALSIASRRFQLIGGRSPSARANVDVPGPRSEVLSARGASRRPKCRGAGRRSGHLQGCSSSVKRCHTYGTTSLPSGSTNEGPTSILRRGFEIEGAIFSGSRLSTAVVDSHESRDATSRTDKWTGNQKTRGVVEHVDVYVDVAGSLSVKDLAMIGAGVVQRSDKRQRYVTARTSDARKARPYGPTGRIPSRIAVATRCWHVGRSRSGA